MCKPEKTTVQEMLRNRLVGTVMILGVGNQLRGDDGAGPLLIRKLEGKTKYLLLDCGETPERYSRDILAAQPDVVMIVDAARLGRPPGAVEIIEPGAIDISGMSTHNLSLGLFIKYLKQQCDADVFMLAVQPGSREFGAEVSKEVAGAIEMVSTAILATGV